MNGEFCSTHPEPIPCQSLQTETDILFRSLAFFAWWLQVTESNGTKKAHLAKTQLNSAQRTGKGWGEAKTATCQK